MSKDLSFIYIQLQTMNVKTKSSKRMLYESNKIRQRAKCRLRFLDSKQEKNGGPTKLNSLTL